MPNQATKQKMEATIEKINWFKWGNQYPTIIDAADISAATVIA